MQDQATDNYTWFRQRLPEFLAGHRGQHALLHNKSVTEFYRTSLDAVMAGFKIHGEGNFSVEPVDDNIEDLGFYSHVSSALHA